MKKVTVALFIFGTVMLSKAHAGFGFFAGFNSPYLTQYGLTYVPSDKFSMELNQGGFDLSADDFKFKISRLEFAFNYHPWGGSFYLGAGIGQMTGSISGVDSTSGGEVTANVSAMTVTPKLGWMWGKAGGGFFAGMEFGYQVYTGAKVDLETNSGLEGDPDYDAYIEDAEEQAENTSGVAVPVMTLIRLGYIF